MDGFPLVVGKKQIRQKVTYEKRDFYCKKCFRQGHTAVVCRSGVKARAKISRKEGMQGLGNEREDQVWKKVGRKEEDAVSSDAKKQSMEDF